MKSQIVFWACFVVLVLLFAHNIMFVIQQANNDNRAQAPHQNNEICNVCNKVMLKKYTDKVLTTIPPQHEWVWWCGGCNVTKPGGVEVEKVLSDKDAWERLNGNR